MIKDLNDYVITGICAKVTSVDKAGDYPLGTTFDFDILTHPKATTAHIIIERIFEKVVHIDLEKAAQYGPFEIVFHATGAPCDLICKNREGDHLYMPSGVLWVLERCRNGDFPPPLLDEDASPVEALSAVLASVLTQSKAA